MKYTQYVNGLIKDEVANAEKLVLFGQNISAGSCLGGLTRGLKVRASSSIVNTQNSENTLTGVGFGLMLNSVSSVFFLKQQDFLILGIDHLVNTYNVLRVNDPKASFTIMPITVDSGYEGPQASFNNMGDFCSIAGIKGFSCTNKIDTRKIIKKHLISPGFRIIGVSQRLLREETLELDTSANGRNEKYFQYKNGRDVTIVCFNYSLPHGLNLHNKLAESNVSSSLFSVNTYSKFNYAPIIRDLSKTKNLVVIDDSKSGNLLCDHFLFNAVDQCRINKKVIVQRKSSNKRFYPTSDKLEMNYNSILKLFKS